MDAAGVRGSRSGWTWRPCAALAVLALAGCGFHLRGAGDVQPLPAILVRGGGTLAAELERTLLGQGTPVVGTAAEAQWIVTLDDVRRERRTAAVGRTGRVQEYELHSSVRLGIEDSAGKGLVPAQTISVERSYSYDGIDVNAKTNEEATLYQDMQFDIVRQILMRLQAIRPVAPDAAPVPAPAPAAAPVPAPPEIPDPSP